MWWLFGPYIDFEAKISHFRQLGAKVQEMTVFGLKINICLTTFQTNHLDLNTIEEENFWKYFFVSHETLFGPPGSLTWP